ncbi:MAG TPA: GntG family PLP-dependent aldolase [Cellulomonas sp.]
MIDLRSDTVTQPTPAMRQAMADAAVGDDVLDGDPTLRELERTVAGLTGREDALWMPTGCMSNLVGLMLHLRRGDRFLAPAHAHVVDSELGTAAWLAQGMPVELPWAPTPGTAGVPSVADVVAAATAGGPYYTLRPALLCLENTHNAAGGSVTDPTTHHRLVAAAHSHGLAVHLDGARIWHAAAALGVEVRELVGDADTVSVCLSKGLGAPVGSVLAGSTDHITEARRIRKMLGGGIRQGGVLGAAGLVALHEGLPRIDDDRLLAQHLADGLATLGCRVVPPATNILLVAVPDLAAALAGLVGVGVLASTMNGHVRFVTHRDVTTTDVDAALAAIAASPEVLAALRPAAA